MADLSFTGDIGLNDNYIHLRQKSAHPFDFIAGDLKSSDLVIGNLECVLKGSKGENLLKRPRVSTTEDTFLYLKDINLGMASLATNHVYDYLDDGFLKTIEFLDEQKILWMGAGRSEDEAKRCIVTNIKGISFCFLNYITSDTNPSLPYGAGIAINEFREEKCIADLKSNARYDYRVVIMHWGGNFEGGLFPDYSQIALSRKIIDSGADLIIGHHSHTLQPYEKYKGKYIFYSLGNFCFSDIHFEGKIRKMTSLRERESVIVNIHFEKNGYKVNLIPVRNENLILHKRQGVLMKLKIRNFFWHFIKLRPIWLIYKNWFLYVRPVIVQLCRKDPDKRLLQRIAGQLFRSFKT